MPILVGLFLISKRWLQGILVRHLHERRQRDTWTSGLLEWLSEPSRISVYDQRFCSCYLEKMACSAPWDLRRMDKTLYLLRTRERNSGRFLSQEDAYHVRMDDQFFQGEIKKRKSFLTKSSSVKKRTGRTSFSFWTSWMTSGSMCRFRTNPWSAAQW